MGRQCKRDEPSVSPLDNGQVTVWQLLRFQSIQPPSNNFSRFGIFSAHLGRVRPFLRSTEFERPNIQRHSYFLWPLLTVLRSTAAALQQTQPSHSRVGSPPDVQEPLDLRRATAAGSWITSCGPLTGDSGSKKGCGMPLPNAWADSSFSHNARRFPTTLGVTVDRSASAGSTFGR
jgi:hypothetical protein